ncbi:unnamed protein product [Litomosoides sigmodontis]|uniref:Uncharacterized protein n=1 Tax=Litomosoides sigmodontis TaxID=42156 RepID=A0A3P6SHQ5_LITSI|nr:unnamed protein product [Litomosoides sigmodontis]
MMQTAAVRGHLKCDEKNVWMSKCWQMLEQMQRVGLELKATVATGDTVRPFVSVKVGQSRSSITLSVELLTGVLKRFISDKKKSDICVKLPNETSCRDAIIPD